MAVAFAGSSTGLYRTSSVLNYNSTYGVAFWFLFPSLPSAWVDLHSISNTLSVYDTAGIDSGNEFYVENQGGSSGGFNRPSGGAISANTWYFYLRQRVSVTSHIGRLYNTSGSIIRSGDAGGNVTGRGSATRMEFNNTAGENESGTYTIYGARHWTGNKTDNEILEELFTTIPPTVTNTAGFWPLVGSSVSEAAKDYSSLGYDWSITGSPTISNIAPPIIWQARPILIVPILSVSGGSQNASVGNSDNTAIGYDVSRTVGSINASVGTVDNPSIGYNLATEYIQTLGSADNPAVGYDTNYSVGSVNSSVGTSDNPGVGYNPNTEYIQTIGSVDISAIGYDSNYNVGSINAQVSNVDNPGIGYNLTNEYIQSLGTSDNPAIGNDPNYSTSVNSQVNSSDNPTIGYDLSTLFIQSLGYADNSGIGYDVNYSVGSINALIDTGLVVAVGYNVSTEGETLVDVGFSDNPTVGNNVSTEYIQVIGKANNTSIGYDLTNSYIIVINKSDALAIGNTLTTNYFQNVGIGLNTGVGYDLNAIYQQLVGLSTNTTIGNNVDYNVGSVTKQIGNADVIAIGKTVNIATFEIILSAFRIYKPKDFRVYKPLDDRIYIPIDKRIYKPKE